MKKRLTIPALLALFLFWAVSALAINIHPYDNILAPDGFYGLAYAEWYHAGKYNDSHGDKAADANLDVYAALLRPIYYFHAGPVPAAMQVIVPFGSISLDSEALGVDETSSGLGDIVLGPGVFLYENADKGTYLSLWFYAIAPTGTWDEDKAVNFGAHHWYFEPQLAFNQTLAGFVLDVNLNYYMHTEESDRNYKAPDRFEVETSLVYTFTPALLAGVNFGGYWDMDEGEADGAKVDGTKARRLQVGPTLAYQFTDRLAGNLRWTHDVYASNDFSGDDFWLRVSYAF